MTKIARRINLFSGPGAGKSTMAAYLFAHLKILGYHIEHVTEAIKEWVYEGKSKCGFDHVYLFGEQLRREDIILRSGDAIIITDSPVLLQVFYSDHVNHCTVPGQTQMALEFEKAYPSYNIFLDRFGLEFQTEGRYEKSVEEAICLDDRLHIFLAKHHVEYDVFKTTDYDKILQSVISHLPSPKCSETYVDHWPVIPF